MNNQAMSNRFQMFWFEGPLSWIELHSFRSFVRFPGTRLHVYSYDKNANPKIDGVEWEDANEILPLTIADQFRRLFDKYRRGREGSPPSWASDAFRYKLLYEKGGWYFDTDCILVKPLDPLFDLDFIFAFEEDDFIGTAVMKFPRGHPMLKAMYEECFRICERLSSEIDVKIDVKFTVFTRLLDDYAKKFGLFEKALPAEYFYPIPYESMDSLFRKPFNPGENAFIIHLWNTRLRRKRWAEKDVHPSILNPVTTRQSAERDS